MYIPRWFQEARLAKLHGLICSNPFAPMVTQVDGRPFATHLPFLLDRARGEFGTLRGHMARANPQWRSFADGVEALVIFQGPHAYVSPTWYAEQPAVPTWNYAVAHVYGEVRCVDGPALRKILTDTVEEFETARDRVTLPDEYFERMAESVVGFEIRITRLEGKVKLSQNRSLEDRLRVIAALRETGRPGDREMADCMELQTKETS